MHYLASYLTPAGAALLLICFFLPWLVVECHLGTIEEDTLRLPEQHLSELSGLDLARARPLFWGMPAAAIAVLLFSTSRLPIRWRYRLSALAALCGLVVLAISYENLQRIDATHLTALAKQDEQSREILDQMPTGVRRLVEDALRNLNQWRGSSGIEVRVYFRQAYSLAWAGCVLSMLSALTMLLRLSKREGSEAP